MVFVLLLAVLCSRLNVFFLLVLRETHISLHGVSVTELYRVLQSLIMHQSTNHTTVEAYHSMCVCNEKFTLSFCSKLGG